MDNPGPFTQLRPLFAFYSVAPYSIVSKAEAAFTIIWDTPAEGGTPHIVHSGIVNSDGSYTSKNNNSGTVSNQIESQFNGRNIQSPGQDYVSSTVYYNRN